jgi:hypothetical protein
MLERLREREWLLYELFYPAGPVAGEVLAPAADQRSAQPRTVTDTRRE